MEYVSSSTTITAIAILLAIFAFMLMRWRAIEGLSLAFSKYIHESDLENASRCFDALVAAAPEYLGRNPTLCTAAINVRLLDSTLSYERLLDYFAQLAAKAVQRAPSCSSLQLLMAGVLLQQQADQTRVSSYMAKAIALSPNSHAVYRYAGQLMFAANRLRLAYSLFIKSYDLLSNKRKSTHTNQLLYSLYCTTRKMGHTQVAMKYLSTAIKLERNEQRRAQLRLSLASEYQQIGDLHQACFVLRQGIQEAPGQSLLLIDRLLETLLQLNDFEEARHVISEAALRQAPPAVILISRARLALAEADYAEVNRLLDLTLGQYNDSYYVNYEAAAIMLDMGNLARAIMLFERAAKIPGITPLLDALDCLEYHCLHERLAEAYLAAERCDDALVAYRRALKQFPENARIMIAIGQIEAQMGSQVESARQLANAEILLAKLYREAPNNAKLHYVMGQLAMANNNNPEALSHFKQVTTAEPNNATAWQRLGQAYLLDGRSEEAQAALEKAISLATYEYAIRQISLQLQDIKKCSPDGSLPPQILTKG